MIGSSIPAVWAQFEQLRDELDVLGSAVHGPDYRYPALDMQENPGTSTPPTASGGQLRPEELAEALHKRVREILGGPEPTGAAFANHEPHFELTRRVARAVDDGRLPDMASGGFCSEAEPRLERTLTWLESGRPSARNYPSAVVLTDVEGEPFALQKASGVETAFAYRDGIFATSRGNWFVPLGAIFWPLDGDRGKGYLEPINETFRGRGLVKALGTQASDVVMGRFASWLLPDLLRRAVVESVAKREPGLTQLAQKSLALSETSLAERVARLLQKGDVLTVEGNY